MQRLDDLPLFASLSPLSVQGATVRVAGVQVNLVGIAPVDIARDPAESESLKMMPRIVRNVRDNQTGTLLHAVKVHGAAHLDGACRVTRSSA